MKRVLLLGILLSCTGAFAQQTAYQAITRNITTASTYCSSSTRCKIIGTGAAFHQLTWNVSGTLSACSVRVDSSADGTTWNSGDVIAAQTCTSNGQITSSATVVNFVRVNVTTITPVSTANLTVNLTGNTSPITAGLFPIIYSSVTSFGISTLASGDNVLYTVPANTHVLVRIWAANPTAGAITVFPTVSPNGTGVTFRAGSNTALAASGSNTSDTNFQSQTNYLGNPGDVFGLNCTALGVNAYGVVAILGTATNYTYKQAVLTTFSIGNNTLYTVPVGKTAYIAYPTFGPLGSVGTQAFYTNESGGATVQVNVVPSGGSVAASNRVWNPAAVATNTAVTLTIVKKMSAGDFINVNTTTNTKQFFTVIILETTP